MLNATFTNISVVVTGVAASVLEELDQHACGPALTRVCTLVPGDIAWDECDCGMFAQSITQTYPSNAFPTPATDTPTTPCGPNLIVVDVLATIVRCIPGVDPNTNNPPTCDALFNAAQILECDRQALRAGVRCFLHELRAVDIIDNFSVGAVTSVGPQGLCGGVALSYRFSLLNVCCS